MKIGIVGDIHAPFTHPMYRRFCMDTFRRYRVDKVHFIGDIVDLHSLSFWEHDPAGLSPEAEADGALAEVASWHKTFPGATVCIGNHDERHYRVARKAGMPDRYLRSYADVWGTPSWRWDFEFLFDKVNFQHGTGQAGKDAAINLAIAIRMSAVIGHLHTDAGVKFHANRTNIIFGVNVGCGIDVKERAFAYGRTFPKRPTLSCAVVIDGVEPHVIPMAIGRGEKYHRSRAGRRRRIYKAIKRRAAA